ncbi:adenylate kinase [Mycoplasma feriruminatoris]|uniref:Adenylate kinase n=1 Tax=Mycoplasma feriruminatoris TaxID=1179777 RepID=A0AAQ3DRZ9_9MOLU|nr:adenylate kinase [Mycoplasma feriruminatoris]WFQ90808.1 adenylate kinase [Mycoplasma feriruminatoris]WFQ92456.1 Adenylate kinase [Mycoplasma feriruminatoris]WFQ93327.1 adenylate kinase [Mycoplasma feriruminatoris]WFQ94984.1 adenylate kinase [Mycoplasma feriruminatoris]WFQ95810.1 adenylate kinase [Mycoplasma feriruminatoris]
MNIMLLGAPGCGKGTQAEQLVNKLDFIQVSTGDLMRKEISLNTSLGLKCQEYMNAGKYVPDEIVNKIVDQFLTHSNDKLIFDGYPRTLEQAKSLEKMLEQYNKKIDYVFYIDVNHEILIKRITNRLVCPVCKASFNLETRKPKNDNLCDFDNTKLVRRSDDSLDKVKIRLQTYTDQTLPLIDYYKTNSKFIEIKADHLSAEQVFNYIKGELKF